MIEKIEKIEGYENLDTLLPQVDKQRRADHLIYNRKVIIEEKEYRSSPEHNAKGMDLEAFYESISKKYKFDFYSPPPGYLENLTEEESEEFRKLKGKFSKKIKDKVHEANKQIAATKEIEILGLQKSIGVALIIIDQIPGILPEVVEEGVGRCFKSMDGDNQDYKGVDIVIAPCLLKDLSILGQNTFIAKIVKNNNPDHHEYGRKILDVLKGKNALRGNRFPTQQLRPHLFR
jgi:hypothetical protein